MGSFSGMGIYFVHTDHLSDRELYEELWSDVLREETPEEDRVIDHLGDCWVIDLIGLGLDAEVRLWLEYYATDRERLAWLGDFSSDGAFESKELPYDRDRHLPGPTGPIVVRADALAS